MRHCSSNGKWCIYECLGKVKLKKKIANDSRPNNNTNCKVEQAYLKMFLIQSKIFCLFLHINILFFIFQWLVLFAVQRHTQ